jgi:hypothetical protein
MDSYKMEVFAQARMDALLEEAEERRFVRMLPNEPNEGRLRRLGAMIAVPLGPVRSMIERSAGYRPSDAAPAVPCPGE